MDLLRYVLDASDAYEAGTRFVAHRLNQVLRKLSLKPRLPINAGAKVMRFRDAKQILKSDLEVLRLFVPEINSVERLPLWAVGENAIGFGDDFESMCLLVENQKIYSTRQQIVGTFISLVDKWRASFDELIGRFQPVLNDLEQRIVDGLGGGQLMGEEIAAEIQEDYNGHFKATLASLRKRRVLSNARPAGYFNPAKRQPPKSGESQD